MEEPKEYISVKIEDDTWGAIFYDLRGTLSEAIEAYGTYEYQYARPSSDV